MKRSLLFCTLLIVANALQAQQFPSKEKVLQSMQRANAYFMEKWPDAGKSIITNKERQSNIWTRSVYYEGLMELYRINSDKKYYDYAVQWGEKHQWGLVGGVQTRHADNHCAGQTYIDLYLLDHKDERIKTIKASIDAMLQSDKKDDWNWIDALQMAMPVFAKLGKLYQDTAYYNKMFDLYQYAKMQQAGNGLYNSEEHLWWRDKDFIPPYKEPNGKNCYWSRGNGWVFAALAKVLTILPSNEKHYAIYLQDFKNMAAALLPLQREDGFWNVSLMDDTHFAGKETSGTSLFTFGFAWGINNGYLNRKIFLPAILKAWNNMNEHVVRGDGSLGFVQGTGKEPKDGQPVTYDHIPDFEDYGLGCFLMAGAEVFKLKN